MLQAAFRESCLCRFKDIWVVFPFPKWTPIFRRRPSSRQAIHLPHRGDRGKCARNYSRWLTSDNQRGCRGCWNIIRNMPENSDWRFVNETCVSQICAPSPDCGADGWSRVNLHWPPWASPKWSELHVLGNHWWWKLGLWVWPRNKANVLTVENSIISSTEESAAGEVQRQDDFDCVLWHWRARSSWLRP